MKEKQNPLKRIALISTLGIGLLINTLSLGCAHQNTKLGNLSKYLQKSGVMPKVTTILNKENMNRFNFYFNNSEEGYLVMDSKKDDYNVLVEGKQWEKITNLSKLEKKIKQIPSLKEDDIHALTTIVPCYVNKEGIQRTLIAYFIGKGKDREIYSKKKSNSDKKITLYSLNKKPLKDMDGGGIGGGIGGVTGGGGGIGGNGCGAAGGSGSSGGATR